MDKNKDKLNAAPLIVVDSGAGIDGWDFVPKDATAPATLARLVTLRSAPGDARRLPEPAGAGAPPTSPSTATYSGT